LSLPLKVCGADVAGEDDEPVVVVIVLVAVCVTVSVVVEWMTFGACLTVTVCAGAVTVLAGVVTPRVLAGVVTVWVRTTVL
jgi:hypothetical protein